MLKILNLILAWLFSKIRLTFKKKTMSKCIISNYTYIIYCKQTKKKYIRLIINKAQWVKYLFRLRPKF